MKRPIIMLAQIKEDSQTSQLRYAWFSNQSVSIDEVSSKTSTFDSLPSELKHRLKLACENQIRSLNPTAQNQLLAKIKDDLLAMKDDLPLTLRAKLGVIL